jgi:ribosomal protein L12E/L44/L45/RPP1/RPP2
MSAERNVSRHFSERLVLMSGVTSVGSSASAQQVAAQRSAAQAASTAAKQSEEQAESPSQEAAEHDGGGLNIQA